MQTAVNSAAVASGGTTSPRRFAGNFGAVRLALSLLVIVGHTPELIDGNRSREPLTQMFGVLSLGELAVTGFFLISGYLLTLSVQSSENLTSYFIKRVARIYPAFVVASLACLIVVAPLAGGSVFDGSVAEHVLRLILLQPPVAGAAFAGSPYPALDGAMWTIAYEFTCYVLLAALFAIGLLRAPRLLLVSTLLILVLLGTRPHLDVAHHQVTFGAGTQNIVRFVAAFLGGVCYRLYFRPEWRSGWVALGCVAALLACLGNKWLAEPALIVCGGYALFWLCERPLGSTLGSVGRKIDLSYGIYLYAWPLQQLAIWNLDIRSPAAVIALTIVLSGCLAFLSWTLVEKPSMNAAFYFIRQRIARRPKPLSLALEDAGAP